MQKKHLTVRSWRHLRLLASMLAVVCALIVALPAFAYTATTSSSTTTLAAPLARPGQPNFGPNVYIFNPSMPQSQIQATVDAIATQQISNQFGTQRYALLFEPGTYGSSTDPLNFQVGYYTSVAGLGLSPNDVVINGSIDVYNQCFGSNNCIALDNFWRSLSNLTINVTNPNGCSNTEFWAVSQAAPMRRVQVNGNTTLMDYCTGPSFASGGFIADSAFSGNVVNGSQQQFFVRNSQLNGWSNGVWNQVFSGVIGAPAQCFPAQTVMRRPVHHARDQPGDTRGAIPVHGLHWAIQRLRTLDAAQLRGYDMGQRSDARLVHLNQQVLYRPTDGLRSDDQ